VTVLGRIISAVAVNIGFLQPAFYFAPVRLGRPNESGGFVSQHHSTPPVLRLQGEGSPSFEEQKPAEPKRDLPHPNYRAKEAQSYTPSPVRVEIQEGLLLRRCWLRGKRFA